MRRARRPSLLTVLAAAWCGGPALAPVPVLAADAAREVVLSLKGSQIEFTGRLNGFDGRTWLLEANSFGLMALDAAHWDCTGEACATVGAAVGSPSTFGLEAVAKRPADSVVILGSSTIGLDLMPALVRGFAEAIGGSARQRLGADPAATRFDVIGKAGEAISSVELRRSGASAALAEVAAGRSSIAMSSRPAEPSEAALLVRPLPGAAPAPSEHVLALDGLAVIVAPGNQLASLGVETIAKIFSGQITSWVELGGQRAPIRVYASTEGGAASDSLDEQILAPRKLKLVGGAIRMANEAALSDAVAADPDGIGITSLSFLRNARALDIATACSIVVKPTSFAIKAEEYPLARRLYLYTAGAPTEATARELLGYAASDRAQAVIRDSQFIDQSVERAAFRDESRRLNRMLELPGVPDADRQRLRALVAGLLEGQRLSITFRFAPNSATLDAKARQDVVRLRQLLKSPEVAGKTIQLIGFTDAVGRPDVNLALSRRRAAQVRAAVVTGDPALSTGKMIFANGFGHLAPVACNATAADLTLNRRVEVWVTDGMPAVHDVTAPAKRAPPARDRRFRKRRG